jgi:hypothetical protein
MARIRTVKPEFWRHPVLGRLQDDYQLLALSLLTMADDEGYFRAEPALIRGDVQPFREDLGNISRGLTELLRVGWIEVGNHPSQGAIGFIVNFTKHQRVHNPTPSKLKGYFLGNISRVIPEDFPLEQGTGNREHELGDITSTSAKAKVQKQPSVTTESFSLDAATSYVLIETKLAGRNIRDVVHEVLQNESGDKKTVAEKLISAWAAYCQAKPKYKQSPENFFARGTWRDPTSWSEDKTAKRADGWLPPQNVADDYVPESVKRRKEIEAAKAAGL